MAQNTVKGSVCEVRHLQSWYRERYREDVVFSSITKVSASYLLKKLFLEVRDTRRESLGGEYELSTLTAYWNGLQRFFLECKDGERFDIGEDEGLKDKLASERKQLKASGKGNSPNSANALDENQMEKLWASDAVGLNSPHQLLHLVWWNNT